MSNFLSIRRAWYEGGHPIRSKPLEGKLRVSDDGIGVRSWHGSVTLPWDKVAGIEFQVPDEPQRRHTLTRMALLGLFAYFLPKKIKASEIVISTADGEFVVMIDRVEPRTLRAKLSPWIARTASRSTP